MKIIWKKIYKIHNWNNNKSSPSTRSRSKKLFPIQSTKTFYNKVNFILKNCLYYKKGYFNNRRL